ncbi:hypothetical protein WR25_08128 [Diploscapter pachys]|uniref:Cyclin-dependent kinase inhibitor domain-containing protein n=1 Tax=Diploscapter pachys TaxID=2018661 RepID=A0A2A2JL45_9BILA|nr:hypothetical protein WR25_08128 [Diploscapter pachys]
MVPTPTSSPSKRPPVRRCLFGRPNPDNVNRMLKEALAEIKEHYESKYGFSFEMETPMATTSSEYVFEAISLNTVPEFYKPRYYANPNNEPSPQKPESTGSSPVSSTRSSPRESDVSMDLTPISPSRRSLQTPKKRQGKVTDYMPVRKHKRLQQSSKRIDIVLPSPRRLSTGV